ncbi:hypothetical protein B0A48_01501 [Cryoendolithus antarcticus]|uniref:Uncharacterized protein n=1 Tax=Cryoendolithus antarcticus TaxID=1507870 RepID=A0A1V8TPG0_9PEZI|nr:hypothetical protein B0A48_01501 [Cryoendolithus antarcticus]
MSFGFSVKDVLEGLRACQQVYRAFASEYQNAPRQFAVFSDELERVEQALALQDQINGWTGQIYPGTSAFQECLKECRHFAEQQRRLIDRHRGKESFLGILQTAASAFEQELPTLRERLSHNRIELVNFNVMLLLQRAFNGADSHTTPVQVTIGASRNSSNAGLPADTSKQVEQVLMRLFRVGYAYKRSGSSAIRTPGSPVMHLEQLGAEFENCISSLCTLIGLPPDSLASLPMDVVADGLSEERWQSMIQSTAQVSRYTNSASVVPHIARICEVKLDVEGAGYHEMAHSYVLFNRTLYWRNVSGLVILEHKLPDSTRKCYPYTQHRKRGLPLTLTWLEMQDVIIKTGNERKLACKPSITFCRNEVLAAENECNLYQHDVRGGRELLHTFHVDNIAAKNARNVNIAYTECCKIWEAPPGKSDRTLSFPAILASSSTKDIEMPLKWFNSPSNPRTGCVRLNFATEIARRTSTTSIPGSNLLRRNTATTVSSAASIRTVNTTLAADSFAPADYISRIGHLDFKLTNPAEVSSFITALADPFAPASRAPSLFSCASPTFTASSPSTISTVASSPPFSFRVPDRRPVPHRTSTAGTSPMSPSTLSELPGSAMPAELPATGFALPRAELAAPQHYALAELAGDDLRAELEGLQVNGGMEAQTPFGLLHDGRGRDGRAETDFW